MTIPIPSVNPTGVPNISFAQIYSRLISQLPPWFGNQQYVAPPAPDELKTPTSNFNNILWAFIITASESYYQLQYDWLQTRIGQYELNYEQQTNPFTPRSTPPIYPLAFGDCLDLISLDFYGGVLPRRPNESDDNYRNRILVNLLRLKATRSAMYYALLALVLPAFQAAGIPVVDPLIIESFDYGFQGGYNDYQALAYNTPISGYGQPPTPYTCTIIVSLPTANGLANYPGYSTFGESVTWSSGFGTEDSPPYALNWYGSDSLLTWYITAQDILNVINLTKVLGTICNLIIQYVTIEPDTNLLSWVDNIGNQLVTSEGQQFIFNNP